MFFPKKAAPAPAQDGAASIARLRDALSACEAVVIGAGAGLSTSAGYTYSGGRFDKYFADFRERYGFSDMYSGGFYPYGTLAEMWAFWSRNILINRYTPAPKPVYGDLLALVQDKDYFVITTNVDHCFQRAGFSKERLFYTQGDYGLFQCSKPCHQKTYGNREAVAAMLTSQGFAPGGDGMPVLPPGGTAALTMEVPDGLAPRCPVCGAPMSMNLRTDDTFVQDEGWYAAARRYEDFLNAREGQKVLFLELGVGGNTPAIIKYPFWKMTGANKNATYACINYGEAAAPAQIARQSVCINSDIGAVLAELRGGATAGTP